MWVHANGVEQDVHSDFKEGYLSWSCVSASQCL